MTENNALNTILHFIEENFNRQITINEIEKISFYSYRNIQRIFKYACGETIGAYQKRLKLEHAYKLILYTKNNFSEIAIVVGFENSASLSKAFKKQFKISPKEARQNKLKLLVVDNITPAFATNYIEPKIIYFPETIIYYQTTKTSYDNNEIEILWEKFSAYIFPERDTEYYGIIADEPLITDKLNCRYDAATTLPAKNKNLPSKKIKSGKYAQFFHYGNYDNIEQTYKLIYTGWIFNSALDFDSSPIIEHYIKHASNSEHPDDFITAILIPLKK